MNKHKQKLRLIGYLIGLWLLLGRGPIQAAKFGDYNYDLFAESEEIDETWEAFRRAQRKKEKQLVKTLRPDEIPKNVVAYLEEQGRYYGSQRQYGEAIYFYKRILQKLAKYESKRAKGFWRWAFPVPDKERIKYLTKLAGLHCKIADYEGATIYYKKINQISMQAERGVHTLRMNACCCYLTCTMLIVNLAGLSLYCIS